jgi:sugar lactone lactonase YvrE
MQILTLFIQSLVALGFLARAVGKFRNVTRVKAEFKGLGRGKARRWSMGTAELLGGLAMAAAMAQPFLAFFVSVFLGLLSAGSLLSRRVAGYKQGSLMLPLLLAGSLVVAVLQPLGLKVLLLPKPVDLPVEAVSVARVLKTYAEGLWLESVAVAPDGTVYLSGNQGEDYNTGDKSQARAQVIARHPDGTERVVFELPRGATAGVIAFDARGQMFMTGQGARRGIWRFSADHKADFFATLPEGSWPNGLTVGPDGQLYVADSALGTIWRVDPNTGVTHRAIQSDSLRARPLIALAPGANGLHFYGRDLYVTVSDSAQVLKFPLNADGTFGAPHVFAEGIPGDDFAIDSDGTLYITTHPFNTIVRVTQDGKRAIVATAAQGILGATDAKFGTSADDRDTLYVATDGGAFSGDAKAKGTLVALRIKR